MKNGIYIIISLSIFCMVSCSDFLNEKISTQVHGEELYATENALEAHIAGCYGGEKAGMKMNGFHPFI